MENSPPLLPNYDMPTLGTCFSSVFCSPWALNPISGAGWPYPLCSVSPSSSSSLSRRILHFRIQASSDIFHLITGGGCLRIKGATLDPTQATFNGMQSAQLDRTRCSEGPYPGFNALQHCLESQFLLRICVL